MKRGLQITAVFGILMLFLGCYGPITEVKVYFFKNEKLVPLERVVSSSETAPRTAIRQLLKGPTEEEQAKGYFTQIPSGTKLRGLRLKQGIAYADFNKKLAQYGGGTARVRGLVAQIVYTLTESPKIERVQILIEGQRLSILGSEGYIINYPLGREDVGYGE